jgi:hypothetical protein
MAENETLARIRVFLEARLYLLRELGKGDMVKTGQELFDGIVAASSSVPANVLLKHEIVGKARLFIKNTECFVKNTSSYSRRPSFAC